MKRDLVAELKALRLHGMAQRLEELQTEGGVGIQSAGWLIASLPPRRSRQWTSNARAASVASAQLTCWRARSITETKF